MSLITLQIEGMSCSGCARSVEASIGKFPGITNVKADHTTGRVHVEFFSNPPEAKDLKEAINRVGFSFSH